MVDLNRGEYFTGAWVISYLSCTVYEREMQPFPISRSSVYHLQYFIYLILLHAPCKITFGFIQSLCCFFWYSLKYVQFLHLAMYQPDTLLCLWRNQGQKKSFFLRYLLTKSRSFLPRQSNSCVSSPFSGRQFSAKGMARAWGSSTSNFLKSCRSFSNMVTHNSEGKKFSSALQLWVRVEAHEEHEVHSPLGCLLAHPCPRIVPQVILPKTFIAIDFFLWPCPRSPSLEDTSLV